MNPNDHEVQTAKRLLLCLPIVFLASCRLVISTDDTGHIASASGQYDCSQPECAIEISEEFNETFTAVPEEGYRFVRWQGLCKSSPSTVCEATVAPLSEEFSQYDGDIGLWAQFESTTKVRLWYRDRDGDHYGDPEHSTETSRQPAGFVVNSADCNDLDESVRPMAKDIWDGIDNNCNGEIDEGLARYYRDLDGDGYGDDSFSLPSTEPLDGYVTQPGDCDDNNDAFNPGVEEVDDGLDNDCDGRIDEDFFMSYFFSDQDGDGFGDPVHYKYVVEMPEGYVANKVDNCPDVSNPLLRDVDDDGIGDACDPDFEPEIGQVVEPPADDPDQDGYASIEDNCPEAYNPRQVDLDGNGIGDACEGQ